ncbi:predicted protein [Uncinocarpus reesii 1704]|uniref:AAA+ ATPase domain-containing protein n=1 Tax=Uncinocarpus reesii (strain UAMH 1704) TaxID=336963 RepID=C4JUW7_UNCRE|nr:uncharacterized protein UREG_04920 [Uncinocarpus reesii 1704]EEP80078.1 predicted protein [Uncinocarpus reesii 1704]
MATILKAMGQHDQRTLHPFFKKHGTNSIAEFPQLANPQLKQLNNQPPCETVDAGSDFAPGHYTNQDENEELSRRKRRKTTPPSREDGRHGPELLSPDTVEPEAVDLTISPPSNDVEERPATARYSLRKATASSTPVRYTFDDPLKDGLRGAKVLQLNPNGKLLNLPAQPSNQENKELKKRSRRRKNEPDVEPSKLAILKYGSGVLSRQYIGGAIHEIMGGNTTYALFKQRIGLPQRAPEPPKPTHSFFLNRQPPKKVDGEPPKTNTQDTIATRPEEQKQPIPKPTWPHVTIAIPRPSSIKTINPRKGNDPVEPLWPPLDMVRIDGDIPRGARKPSKHILFDQKKSKGPAANVPDPESILGMVSRSLKKDRLASLPTESILRHPKRTLQQGPILTETIASNLHGPSKQGAANGDMKVLSNSSSQIDSSHPAVTALLSSIATTRSSFEKGGYDDSPWTQKYAPNTALRTLQAGSEAVVLRQWLQNLTVSSVNTGTSKADAKTSKSHKETLKKKKKRKRGSDIDDFIVSSGDEESRMDELTGDDDGELAGAVTVSRKTLVRAGGLLSTTDITDNKLPLSNTILLSGPPGCGKSAAVYAVANELDFEVFEINPGSRRSAKDVVERVGDMTQNHLVQTLKQMDSNAAVSSDIGSTSHGGDKQISMGRLFKQKPSSSNPSSTSKTVGATNNGGQFKKLKTNQRQSLILLEEVDILFAEDKQFWNGVLALIAQSKRPIVMTCNDEGLLPMDNLSLHAILRFRPPPPDLVADYISTICANEGHIVDPKAIFDLYTVLGKDLRATIMQLNYWCQMAVGSQKSGLDWIVDRPLLSKFKLTPDLPRILSLDTYIRGIGWVPRDMVVGRGDTAEKRIQLVAELLEQWHISVMDWVELRLAASRHNERHNLKSLEQVSFLSDMESSLDLLCRGNDPSQAMLDYSLPPTPGEKQHLDYIEGHQFIQADSIPDYSGMSKKLCVTLSVLLENVLSDSSPDEYERDIIEHILQRAVSQTSVTTHQSMFERAFRPILDGSDYPTPASGLRPLSFEHGTSILSQDVAPYIRFIVACDSRIEQQRLEQSGILAQTGFGAKRPRTTRASRAALEGGDKASARRGKWFSGRVVPEQIMLTGGPDWENLLLLHLQQLSEERLASGTGVSETASSDIRDYV